MFKKRQPLRFGVYSYLVHVSHLFFWGLCSGERLSYVYEVTETVWKPQLRLLLSRRLTALTRLTLAQFCDDDTLCLVGQCCPLLQLLRSTLGFMNPVLCGSAFGFIADPDPAFYLNADPDPDPGGKPLRIRILDFKVSKN
jgi:hypothetical protein